MSLATYDGLLAEAADWLDRSDLTARIPSFVTLVEAEITRVLRRTTRRATITVGSESVPLPGQVAELRSLRFASATRTSDVPIRVVTPEMLTDIRARSSATARPQAVAVVGNSMLFAPAPDTVYDMEITYFERLVPLSETNQVNLIFHEAPDVYLYGVLREAASFLEHDERAPVWDAKFQAALNQLAVARQREEHGASLQPARLPVVF